MRIGRLMVGRPFAMGRVEHGPQDWPWWRLASLSLHPTNPGRQNPRVPCWHLWLYTRWGALVLWFGVDRRPKAAA